MKKDMNYLMELDELGGGEKFITEIPIFKNVNFIRK